MRILSIGAHPDDIEFGCGAALKRFSQNGWELHLSVATSGEVGGNPALRRREQERSAKALGARLYWGDYNDTKLILSRELIESLETRINSVRPDLVFTHYPEDTHQDHRALAQAVMTAARHTRDVLFFEGPTTLNFAPSVFVEMEDSMRFKLRLLACHKSQINKTNIPNLSILEMAKSTAIFRGYQNRMKYAEGFMPHRLSLFPGRKPKTRS